MGIACADKKAKRVYGVHAVTIDKDLKGEDAIIAITRAFQEEFEFFVMGMLNMHQENGSGLKAAIEYPVIYPPRSKASNIIRPNDIKNLAGVACGAMGVLLKEWKQNIEIELPTPQTWKGSRPKKVMHKHICNFLGWTFTEKQYYVIPDLPSEVYGADVLNGYTASHVMDAIGLALWMSTK
jgi:hypothetical protein